MINIIIKRKQKLFYIPHDNPVRAIVLRRNKALPEVNPLFPAGAFPMNELWQHFFKDVLNPIMPPLQWRNMCGGDVAFFNDQGFQMENDPRRDYINNLNLDAVDERGRPAYPKMEMLLCGDTKFIGQKYAEKIYVETLDGNIDPPSDDILWVNNNPYHWYRAVTINPLGIIRNMPQGGNDLIKRIPIVSRYPVYVDTRVTKVIEIE